MSMNYANYVAMFNSGKDDELCDRFFTPDVIMESTGRTINGIDEMRAFLSWAHEGVREILRPQAVAYAEDRILAEIDIDFHASVEKPDFQFKPLKKGESTTVKFFVVYSLRGRRVCNIKAAYWPAEQGASSSGSVVSGPNFSKEDFQEYLSYFNGGDFDRLGQFYTEDVQLELRHGQIDSRQGIIDFYRNMTRTVRENLTVNQLIIDADGIAADLDMQFTAIADAPDFVVAPMKKGEIIRGRVFVHYTLRDGKIAAIKVARKGEITPPSTP
jgi:ketosteroid isomerase-like protein